MPEIFLTLLCIIIYIIIQCDLCQWINECIYDQEINKSNRHLQSKFILQAFWSQNRRIKFTNILLLKINYFRTTVTVVTLDTVLITLTLMGVE